jgi:hypothetical protein
MDRIEFFRRQADRFSKLAKECTDKAISAKLNAMAAEYGDMLDGKALAASSTPLPRVLYGRDAAHRPIAVLLAPKRHRAP